MSQRIKKAAIKVFQMKESGVIIPTILFMVIIALVNPAFISMANVFNVLRSTGFTLITALGMTFVPVSYTHLDVYKRQG